MRLIRTGYDQDKYKTILEVETKNDNEAEFMFDSLREHHNGIWEKFDEWNTILYLVYTDDVEDFRTEYKKLKAKYKNMEN